MAMNKKIQMWLYAKSCHNHEQGPLERVSKPIWRYLYMMEYNLMSHDYCSQIGVGPMKRKQQLRKVAAT